jgi:hypothetical protein
MRMTFQEIRIIATGPCIANQLRDVNTICRRSWYIAAHVWKIYDFKIEVDFFKKSEPVFYLQFQWRTGQETSKKMRENWQLTSCVLGIHPFLCPYGGAVLFVTGAIYKFISQILNISYKSTLFLLYWSIWSVNLPMIFLKDQHEYR